MKQTCPKRSRRILVTGGCGFIGSEVVRQLLKKGYKVRVADNLSKTRTTESHLRKLRSESDWMVRAKKESKVKKGYEFLKVDLTRKDQTNKAFKGIDYCFNLAAKIGGIGYFHKYPATILSENNKIYSATFEAAVKNKIKRMIYISSSMVFELAQRFPSKEKDLKLIPSPITAYGFSKVSGERYCQAFWQEYGLPFSICRPFNAYGINEFPGEEIGYSHVIPDLVKKILQGQYPLELLGDSQQTRCFTHIKDLARGIIMVMESEKAENEDFNVGTSKETRMIDLAKMLWQLCGRKEPFKVKLTKGFKYDVKRRVPDVSKIKKLVGWKPKISLEEGLREVVSWLRKELK